MAVTIVSEPSAEPVTTIEAKSHLRVDGSDDDTYIATLVSAARRSVEIYTQTSLITQTLKLSLDGWGGCIRLPYGPVQSVTSIKYMDSNGTQQTWDSGNYQVDTASDIPRITLEPLASWPTLESGRLHPVEITYTAGYGVAGTSVPTPLKQAILLLVGHWYENREAVVVGTIVSKLPFAVEALLAQYDLSGGWQ